MTNALNLEGVSGQPPNRLERPRPLPRPEKARPEKAAPANARPEEAVPEKAIPEAPRISMAKAVPKGRKAVPLVIKAKPAPNKAAP